MDAIQIHPLIIPSLVTLFLLWSITKFLRKANGKKLNLPPSPPKMPIIGNLHQVGSLPHRNLQTLAQKHGPLMLLRFGSVPVLIASSADVARDIMKTHDITFATRPLYKIVQKIVYNGKNVGFAPYGEYWRQVKSIFVLQLLSQKRVQSFRFIREEETAAFLKKVGQSSGPVNLSKMFFEFSNDGVCRSAFGAKQSEMEHGKKFVGLMADLSEVLGAIGIGEFIPWLSWVDRVSGFDAKVDKVVKGLDDILETVIEGRLETIKEQSYQENFLDIMLEIYNENNSTNDQISFDRESIKALILDIFAAGTDTTATALEWAMTELLRHPQVMEKLQHEVREIVGDKKDITDDDLQKMQYLKFVIKETLRCHPPLPLLLPRVARKDVNIHGYDISEGTLVMTNAFAVSMDPSSWDEPEKFKPERFLDSSVEYKGLDFELIPFGAGRRGCPGMTYAMSNIEFLLANLMQKFDWKLPNGAQGEDLDMSEGPGLTVHKRIPLLAVATARV